MKLPFEQNAEALIDRAISKQPELKDDMEQLRSWFNYHRVLVNWHKKYVTFDSYASLDVLRTIKKQIKNTFFPISIRSAVFSFIYTAARNAIRHEETEYRFAKQENATLKAENEQLKKKLTPPLTSEVQ